MWKNENHFSVSIEERELFNKKIVEAFKKRGKTFEILDDWSWSKPPYIAYMQIDGVTGEVRFKCGTYWNDVDNICPVIAMTHELGHYIDLTENFNGNYGEYYRQLGTLELEIRAWEYGFKVCKEMGFNRWDVFYKYARHCLQSYFNGYQTFANDSYFGFNGKRPTFIEALQRLQALTGVQEEFPAPVLELDEELMSRIS